MSKNDKQKTTSSMVSTPTNPEWVTSGVQSLFGDIGELQGMDPKSFYAGPSELQGQQFGLAGNMGNAANTQLTGASSAASRLAGYDAPMIGGVSKATASSAAQNMGSYYNPFQEQVADNTTQEMLRGLDLATNRNSQGAQLSGQYGGSRQGVLDANTNRDFFGQLGNALGNLNLQGFNTAAQYGNADADRQTGVSQFNAGQENTAALANQQAGLAGAGIQGQGAQLLQNQGLAGYNALAGSGATQQGINQGLAGAPLEVLQALSGMAGSLPTSLFQGSIENGTGTSTVKSGLLSKIGNGLKIGGQVAQMISDRRLKQDIRPAGRDGHGRDWYDYRYLWDAPEVTRHGVMAQEIMASDPDAVLVHDSGYLMVDYAKLEG